MIQVEVCRSLHTKSWLGILYAYKGLLLVVGVYMAWETRHVKIPALNDSQYIGISVYGAVITSASVVVLANLLSERVTLAFIIITSIILTSTTATLCLVFLPKMNDIWNKGMLTKLTFSQTPPIFTQSLLCVFLNLIKLLIKNPKKIQQIKNNR